MSPHVHVARDGRGRLVAVKAAWPPRHEAALVREAAVLAAVRHPGIVSLAGLATHEGRLELHTSWVGSQSLADVSPLPVEQAATVVGAVAATAADLHNLGIAHGAIEPTHVLLDRLGRPVLCSLGRAHLPRATGLGAHDTQAADVAALGALLETAVGLPDDPELVPSRRFGRRRANHLHRHLLTIADHAQADDPTARPTAARLAAALAELAPDASFPVPRPAGPSDATDRHDRVQTGTIDDDLERLRATAATVPQRRYRWPFGAAAVAVVASVSGGAFLANPARNHVDGAAPSPASTTSVARPTAPATTTVALEQDRTPGPTPIVELDGHRYRAGASGDVAATGPWRCDGRARVLLLRPSTGELFLFDEPVPGTGAVEARAFVRQQDAVELVPPAAGDPCPQPAVVLDDGRVVPIAIPAPRT